MAFHCVCLTLDQSSFLSLSFSVCKMGLMIHVFWGGCEDQRQSKLSTKYMVGLHYVAKLAIGKCRAGKSGSCCYVTHWPKAWWLMTHLTDE